MTDKLTLTLDATVRCVRFAVRYLPSTPCAQCGDAEACYEPQLILQCYLEGMGQLDNVTAAYAPICHTCAGALAARLRQEYASIPVEVTAR